MRMLFSFFLIAMAFIVHGVVQGQQIYPSTATAIVIPGDHEVPTAPGYAESYSSPDAVKQWELNHADLLVGGDQGNALSDTPEILGYMFNQKLEFSPTPLEIGIRDSLESKGKNYEDLFLHFTEDTSLLVTDPADGQLTPFGRLPTIVGWTTEPGHAGYLVYQQAPYDKPVWEHHQNGGGLHVLLFERFDRLYLDLSATASTGQLVVQYPSAAVNGVVSQWSDLTVIDNTNNLQQSGEIRWEPPTDWVRASTHDGSKRTYGGGPYFGKVLVRDGGGLYAVRLLWKNGSGQAPRLQNIQLRDWMPVSASAGQETTNNLAGSDKSSTTLSELTLTSDSVQFRTIPGWDARNDRNGDGYVNDQEFADLVNPSATARFRYESRVVPLGKMWSPYSSWCQTNVFNSSLGEELATYHNGLWTQQGMKGAYNDEATSMLQKRFTVMSGGRLAEYDGLVSDDAAELAYRNAFASTLTQIHEGTQGKLGVNVSMINPWLNGGSSVYIPASDIFLREAYLRPSLGLSGWFGLNRVWDTFALAALERRSVVMTSVNWGSRVSRLGNTQANWEKDLESTLAQYYLVNVPSKTFFHAWNKSAYYGSRNTSLAIYYQAGVPKNMAYHPEGLLSADIGAPVDQLANGREPMVYMHRSTTSDYVPIGSTADTLLKNSVLPGGELKVIPSNIFYLSRSTTEVVPQGPKEMVLAREYTKGLVLFRTDFFGHDASFQQSTSEPLALPGTYQRVNYDGSLSAPITSISLSGYEGAILVRVDDNH